jgi:hypothetical protein
MVGAIAATMSSSSMLASGSIFQTKRMKARPMSCAAMRPLRSSRSSSLRAWAEGPIIDRSMMRRSFSLVAGSLSAICMTARSTGSCSGFRQFSSI